MGQPMGCPLSYPSLFAMATSCCHPFSAISPLTDAYGFAPIHRHYVQSIQHLFDRSSMAKQNCSHRANVICDGSPSRIFRVRRISLGMTTRPRSSDCVNQVQKIFVKLQKALKYKDFQLSGAFTLVILIESF